MTYWFSLFIASLGLSIGILTRDENPLIYYCYTVAIIFALTDKG